MPTHKHLCMYRVFVAGRMTTLDVFRIIKGWTKIGGKIRIFVNVQMQLLL